MVLSTLLANLVSADDLELRLGDKKPATTTIAKSTTTTIAHGATKTIKHAAKQKKHLAKAVLIVIIVFSIIAFVLIVVCGLFAFKRSSKTPEYFIFWILRIEVWVVW
ncbi:hypothetical protein QBC38DRAFT_461714 [Podospora fimiseda]|uniref:Uncharacterized protein n=1 Tax=Podospora fimiseda TaxID=252190 RepID=A0AAN6YRR4_9PEZI|nr:hypothetical protein QBC38DRAFT_461714 [Podospora fimiseda]